MGAGMVPTASPYGRQLDRRWRPLLGAGVQATGQAAPGRALGFSAGNLRHSPAKMGYLSLIMPGDEGPGWQAALAWNVVRVGIGNIIGSAALVGLPVWFALDRPHRRPLPADPE
jgi:hypothetical protein